MRNSRTLSTPLEILFERGSRAFVFLFLYLLFSFQFSFFLFVYSCFIRVSLVGSFTHSPTHPLLHLHIHSSFQSFVHSPIHSFTHPFVCPSFIHPPTHYAILPSIHFLFIHSSTHPYIYSFVYSLFHSHIYPSVYKPTYLASYVIVYPFIPVILFFLFLKVIIDLFNLFISSPMFALILALLCAINVYKICKLDFAAVYILNLTFLTLKWRLFLVVMGYGCPSLS